MWTRSIPQLALQHWKLFAVVPVFAALMGVLLASFLPPSYVGTATFVLESRGTASAAGGLGALIGQFGITVPREGAQSPRFYAELAKSRALLELLLQTPFGVAGDSAVLLSLLRVRGESEELRLYRGVRLLRKRLNVIVDPLTNIVRVRAAAGSASLAAAMANEVVSKLNNFNLRVRQSQARARRAFVEARAEQAQRDLLGVEETLREFLDRNRDYERSPMLRFQYARFERQVQVRQEVYLTLMRELETARIEEVNDTPLLTVIDSATVPPLRDGPSRLGFGLAALFVGLLASAGAAAILDRRGSG